MEPRRLLPRGSVTLLIGRQGRIRFFNIVGQKPPVQTALLAEKALCASWYCKG
jgi:hypothetical protein